MSNVFLSSNRSECTKRGACIVMVLVMYCHVKTMAKKPIPITTPFAIFTPSSEIVFRERTAMVLYTIDTLPYWNKLSSLALTHKNLTHKAKTLGLSLADWPQFASLSNHGELLIEDVALTLLNTLEILPHPVECKLQTHIKVKRDIDVVQHKGLFTGLGRALSWITGSLDDDAANWINSNFNNIQKLTAAQTKQIKVLNHTSHIAFENSVAINKMQNKLDSLNHKINENVNKTELREQVMLTLEDINMGILQVQVKVQELIDMTQYAVKHEVAPEALKGPIWPQIVEALDPITRAFPNLKYYVQKSSSVKVEGCITMIYILYNIPLITSRRMWAYKVYRTPVKRNSHYQALEKYPAFVTWDEKNIYEFNQGEFNSCINLDYMLVCDIPKSVKKLRVSCLFTQIKDLVPKCNYTVTQNETTYIDFHKDFLTFYLPPNTRKLADLYCQDDQKSTREIKNAGTYLVPHDCAVYIDDHRYASMAAKSHKFIDYKPKFFSPDMSILNRHPTVQPYVNLSKQVTPDEFGFLMDQEDLEMAKDILGDIKLEPKHIMIAGISFTTVLAIVILMVVILFFLYCRPLCCICQSQGTTRVHRPSI